MLHLTHQSTNKKLRGASFFFLFLTIFKKIGKIQASKLKIQGCESFQIFDRSNKQHYKDCLSLSGLYFYHFYPFLTCFRANWKYLFRFGHSRIRVPRTRQPTKNENWHHKVKTYLGSLLLVNFFILSQFSQT